MLAQGPYPTQLESQVGRRSGASEQSAAAGLLRAIDKAQLKNVASCPHQSEKNNLPRLALGELGNGADGLAGQAYAG